MAARMLLFFALGGLREQEIGEMTQAIKRTKVTHPSARRRQERIACADYTESRWLEERVDGAAFVVAGIFLFESGSDGFHGGPGLRNVNLRFHAPTMESQRSGGGFRAF